MAQPSQQSGAITGINVTPLVDVTLVLLVVFMVTARLIASSQALSVDLPRAATGSEVQSIFSVVIRSNGELSIDGVTATEDRIVVDRARAERARNRELRAVIQADSAVSHGRVMRVLDLLRQAGVSKVGFGVSPHDPPPAP
jgi:biopolymer transport protein ExbD